MLVTKGKSVYQYKSVREEDGGRKTLYEGKLSPQQIQEHHKRKEEQDLQKQSQDAIASLRDALDEFRSVTEWIIRSGLIVQNNQYIRRGEIRSINNAN